MAKTVDSRWESVKTLLVHNKEITLEQVHCINDLLRKLKSLQVLDLCDTTLSESDIVELTDGVVLPELKCIKLPFIPIVKNCIKVLQLLRFDSHSTFESVHAGPTPKNASAQIFFNCLQSSFNSCDIIGGNFDKKRTLLNHIELSKGLYFDYISACTVVMLENCGIDDSIMTRICRGLKKSMLTEKIALNYNRISGAGAVVLASSLQCLSTLKHLSIACNLIDDSGAKALARVLCQCTSLNCFNLEGNRIGDEGAVAIVEALDKNVELHLWNDKMTREGIRKILDLNRTTHIDRVRDLSFNYDNPVSLTRVLKCCTSFSSIKFSLSCQIGKDNMTALAKGLKSCTNLLVLDISRNYINSEYIPALTEGLKSYINLQ